MQRVMVLALLVAQCACTGEPTGPASQDSGVPDAAVTASSDAGAEPDGGAQPDSGVTDSGVGNDGGSDPDAGAPCALPTSSNGNGWAPELSPDGCSIASGLGSVWVNGVLVEQQGWQPVWVSDTRIVFNGYRADGSEGLKYSDAPFTATADMTVPAAFIAFGGLNDLDGAPGRFAGYHAAGDFAVLTSDGHRFPSRLAPALSDSDGALAMVSRDDKTIYLAIGAQETPIGTEAFGATDVDVQGDWVVWSQFVMGGRKTRAYRRSTGVLSDVTASNRANEFFPLLVPTTGETWLINFDGGGTYPDRLYVRPLGSTDVVLLHSGEVRIPTGRFHAATGKLRLAWSDGSGVSQVREVDPATARAPLPP